MAFAQEGCEVIAVDVDARKVEAIAAGRAYIEDVPSELLQAVSERIHACTRYSRLAERAAGGARVDHLPRNDTRADPADPRGVRAGRRP